MLSTQYTRSLSVLLCVHTVQSRRIWLFTSTFNMCNIEQNSAWWCTCCPGLMFPVQNTCKEDSLPNAIWPASVVRILTIIQQCFPIGCQPDAIRIQNVPLLELLQWPDIQNQCLWVPLTRCEDSKHHVCWHFGNVHHHYFPDHRYSPLTTNMTESDV